MHISVHWRTLAYCGDHEDNFLQHVALLRSFANIMYPLVN